MKALWKKVSRGFVRHHGVEYGAEALGLGLFMVSACVVALVLEHPDSWVRQQMTSGLLRRFSAGLLMAGTLIGLVHSPWGRRSGAHLNPAVTLAFAWAGKVASRDVAGYIAAQFVGGALGVGLVASLAGPWLRHPAVHYVVTVPGEAGPGLALALELVISMILMAVVMKVSRNPDRSHLTAFAAAALLCLFITVESPWSGTSMNPARTVASAVVAGIWTGWWIYFVAPLAGMMAGAGFVAAMEGTREPGCAKLCHDARYRCIFCEHQNEAAAGRNSKATSDGLTAAV